MGWGVRSEEAQSIFPLRRPGKQRQKPGAQAQLSPKTALPSSAEHSLIISELVQQPSFIGTKCNTQRGKAVCSRSHSKLEVGLILELRPLAYLVGAAVGAPFSRATCKPLFLTCESRMIPRPEALGLGTGFTEPCWCCSFGLGWFGCLVSPAATMALTSRMAPRTGQSIRSRMTWRAGAGLCVQEGGCY